MADSRDNIGTGWSFPVRVENAGPASVVSMTAGPYNVDASYINGLIYISMNGGSAQTFAFNTALYSTDECVAKLSGLRGGRAYNDGGYLRILSEEINAMKSSIHIEAPPDGIAKRDIATALFLPKGLVRGVGTGRIAWTRNPVQSLVTPDETKRELGEALFTLLMTNIGEMPMIRSFGVGLQSAVFKKMDSFTAAEIKRRIIDGTAKWDKRIFPTKVNVITDPVTNSGVVEIDYTNVTQQSQGNIRISLKDGSLT